MNTTVFSAFPKAVLSDVWHIGKWASNTRVGNTYEDLGAIDVIEDEGGSMSFGSSPNAEIITYDALLYVRPSDLPTTNLDALKADYMLFNGETDEYFTILDTGVGKNQETGEIEHIELRLVQTEAEDVE